MGVLLGVAFLFLAVCGIIYFLTEIMTDVPQTGYSASNIREEIDNGIVDDMLFLQREARNMGIRGVRVQSKIFTGSLEGRGFILHKAMFTVGQDAESYIHNLIREIKFGNQQKKVEAAEKLCSYFRKSGGVEDMIKYFSMVSVEDGSIFFARYEVDIPLNMVKNYQQIIQIRFETNEYHPGLQCEIKSGSIETTTGSFF